ncbi:Transcription factor fungi [Macrophomina phaseolina MS6]|uniref:Transcription factor fungi n=1 Tax=Macrophomina phaseolina (strain MS6) TaxID=1126212 RepID=K2QIG3_MACPH|nr:Transcription factor fungi [Macrophomina phaseolina MS6]
MIALGLVGTSRVLGLGPREQRDLAWAFFVRCRDALRQGSAAAASLEALQAHALMALFLLQEGDCSAVYHMLGIAIRKAHMIGLHRAPAADAPPAERATRGRLWWLLASLDVACALQLGAPPAIHLAMVACPLPDPAEDLALARWAGVPASACQAHLAHLAAALQAAGACELAVELLGAHASSATAVDACAGRLQRALDRLRQWRAELPPALRREPDPDAEAEAEHARDLDLDLDLERPAWVAHQRVLLDLAYHGAHVLLLRPFVNHAATASAAALPPSVAPHVDGAAGVALHVIRLVHTLCSDSDPLYGSTVAVHALWVAAVTLASAAVALPLCVAASDACAGLAQALEVFQWLAPSCPLAAHAHGAVQAAADRVYAALGSDVAAAAAASDELASLWDPTTFSAAGDASPPPPLPASAHPNLDLAFPSMGDSFSWPLDDPPLF